MKKAPIYAGIGASIALSLFTATAAFATGAAKPEHPCYDVADCKTQPDQKAFSACIKQNEAEANANEACAEFRKDKDGYMQKHGIDSLEALFEAG